MTAASHSACPAQISVGSGFQLSVMAKTKAMCIRSSGLPTDGVCKGSTNRVSSPSSSPKSVVGDFDVQCLPTLWDNESQIRLRLRKGENLLMRVNHSTGISEAGFVEASAENCILNCAVLKPILNLMKSNGLRLPAIPMLIPAIEKFYLLCKVHRGSDQIYREAWGIRRLIGRMKKFVYRSFPPQDLYIGN